MNWLIARITETLRRRRRQRIPPEQALTIARQECARLGLEWEEPSTVNYWRSRYLVKSPSYPMSSAGFLGYFSNQFYVDAYSGEVRYEEGHG